MPWADTQLSSDDQDVLDFAYWSGWGSDPGDDVARGLSSTATDTGSDSKPPGGFATLSRRGNPHRKKAARGYRRRRASWRHAPYPTAR